MATETLDLEKLSPRLRKLIAYVFENTFNPDLPDDKAKVGAIGVSIEDLYYVLNMAARAEIAATEPTAKEDSEQ